MNEAIVCNMCHRELPIERFSRNCRHCRECHAAYMREWRRYYATDRAMRHTWVEAGFFYDCHRFPQTIEKECGDYCGEFAWKRDASLLKEAN